MNGIINYFQLFLNSFALMVAGWIYVAYIKNKDEQIKTVEKNMRLWKDKAEECEKKSPDTLNRVLNERIKILEDEIKRMEDQIKKMTVDYKQLVPKVYEKDKALFDILIETDASWFKHSHPNKEFIEEIHEIMGEKKA